MVYSVTTQRNYHDMSSSPRASRCRLALSHDLYGEAQQIKATPVVGLRVAQHQPTGGSFR